MKSDNEAKVLRMSEEGISRLADRALDAACELMQKELGVPRGDYAANVFCGGAIDHPVIAYFKKYIRGEMSCNREVEQVKISTPCPHCGREENGLWYDPSG